MTIAHDRFRVFIILAGVAGGLGVVFGAFGAHGLRDRLGPEMLPVFETAVRYQMYHALALLATAMLTDRFPDPRTVRLLHASGWSFLSGMIVFSGSLYALTLTGEKWLGAITPLGGGALIVGWMFLILAFVRRAGP
jgi:uncharacterized membrane protein YgdD (TMEM256/DUF423 family)